MKQIKLKLLLSAVAFGMLSLVSPVSAQVGKVTVGKPDFDDLQSPIVGGNTGKKSFKPKDWLEAEVKFKVDMGSTYKGTHVDNVTVRWYVAAKNPNGKGYVMLEREVNHINVPVGEDVYSSVYLSPTAIKRLSGKDRASKSVVDFVGGEILVNGSAAHKGSGLFTSKGKVRWWESGKLSRNNTIPLLDKSETPFQFLWWDRYAEIKRKR